DQKLQSSGRTWTLFPKPSSTTEATTQHLCKPCVLVKGIPTTWSVQALYVRSQRESSLWIWMEPRNSCLRLSPAILMENPSRLKQKAMCLSSAQGRTKSQC
ncbi:hypothetical protein M9458_014168, partial [Cirrhinus mrigala]